MKAKSRSRVSAAVGARFVASFERGRVDPPGIGGLQQIAAGERAQGQFGRGGIGERTRDEDAQRGLAREDRRRAGCQLGRDHHLDEEPGDRRRRRVIEGTVHRDDAAERAHRIASERARVSGGEIAGDRDAAGIGMLDDGDGRRGELGGERVRGIGVVEVVVGELLALHLARGRNPRPRGRP